MNLAGYRLYFGPASDMFSNRIDLDNPSAISWTVSGLAQGTWYFSVTAIDNDRRESEVSAAVAKTIN